MRGKILCVFLFLKLTVFAQQMVLTDTILPNTMGCERDPFTLAHKLIEGKKTDKEKFDVIFTWVTRNIRYDYGLYLSPHGSTQPDTKRILRRKKGICLDYAALMDTLCKVAGLQSVSVYGYAKDDLFDVHDSIYMDNHAWNAVKLNNYWYVYDVTWSSGQYRLKLRKISEWIYRGRLKIISKEKERILRFKSVSSECGTGNEHEIKLRTLKWRQRVLLNLLYLFPLHTKRYFAPPVNPLFYLSDPETFAITHFPDNPYWSLTGNYKTIVDFEKDSAYYHLTEETLLKQKREGRHCGNCDDYLALNPLQKTVQMKTNSREFNRKNTFVTADCNFELAILIYKQSIPEADSAIKITLLDSTITYLKASKADFQQSRANVSKESSQQRAKNNAKMKLLNEENKKHHTFVREVSAALNKETEKMKKFALKERSAISKFKTDKKQLKRLPDKFNDPDNFKASKKSEVIKRRLNLLLKETDSINRVIEKSKDVFNLAILKLSNRIWAKVTAQEELFKPFQFGELHRLFYLEDNYEKVIVTERNKLPEAERRYASDLRDSIFKVSDTCADLGEYIFKLLKKRNELFTQTAKMIHSLKNDPGVATDSLSNFIRSGCDRIQEDICWINGRSSVLQSTIYGFEALKNRQELLLDAIQREKRAEYKRFRKINGEITRRTLKFKRIPAHNMQLVSVALYKVRQEKRNFLHKLRDERKRQKK